MSVTINDEMHYDYPRCIECGELLTKADGDRWVCELCGADYDCSFDTGEFYRVLNKKEISKKSKEKT